MSFSFSSSGSTAPGEGRGFNFTVPGPPSPGDAPIFTFGLDPETARRVETNIALRTQLDATGIAFPVFQRFGDPEFAGEQAFSYLAHNDLLMSAASTCVIFRQWSAHYVRAYAFNRGRTGMPRRMTVDWRGHHQEIADVPMMMARIAPRFTNLRTVCLNKAGSGGWVDIDDAVVVTLARNCAALTDVDVSRCEKLTDTSIMALANGCVHVRRLNLLLCKKITDASVTYLTTQCSELTDLDVRFCRKLTVATLTAISRNCSGLLVFCFGYFGCASVTDESVSTLFAGCPKLTSIQLDGCASLTKVVLPDSIAEIREQAFNGCSSLASITVPDSVTSIGNCAFASCSSLTSITVPDSVTSIHRNAFWGCRSLTNPPQPRSR